MPEQLLNRADVVARLEQMSGKGVTEGMTPVACWERKRSPRNTWRALRRRDGLFSGQPGKKTPMAEGFRSSGGFYWSALLPSASSALSVVKGFREGRTIAHPRWLRERQNALCPRQGSSDCPPALMRGNRRDDWTLPPPGQSRQGVFAQWSLLSCLCSVIFAQLSLLSCLCSGIMSSPRKVSGTFFTQAPTAVTRPMHSAPGVAGRGGLSR